ncbi:MAG: transglutaminase domain-containing protein [Bacteroidaceae bacterium]|nr:transglutaminase domain-containing protein [Bacteroidaceae bacterium]
MKQLYTIFTAVAASVISISCSDDNNIGTSMNDIDFATMQTKSFVEEDDSKELSGAINGQIATLLNTAGPEIAGTLNRMLPMTDEEYNEIATFTNNLVKNCTTEAETYITIFDWIVANISYEYGYDNEPYPVFKNKKAICQGYSNLLNVMLTSQGIPCINVNGLLLAYPGGGHAWNYVYYNNRWYVSDPTNNMRASLVSYSKYQHLSPTSIDAILFEDECCTYTFYESQLNIHSIKANSTSVSIPYSVKGIKVTSLNPATAISPDIEEIYIGSNIKTLGENFIGLATWAPNLQRVFVDPDNTNLESFSNVVYKKNGTDYSICFIPSAVRHIELKPIANFDKESSIKNLHNLETVTFVPGTASIGAYTVEKCPKLHTAYVANSTSIDESAFTGVAADFKIIRGDYTNIVPVKY